MTETVQVTFIDHQGNHHPVAAELDQSLMEAAVIEGVPGILAECGGVPQCGSCSVEVPAEWRDRLGEADDAELSVLRFTNKSGPNRRLCCQLVASHELAGLTLLVPEKQY